MKDEVQDSAADEVAAEVSEIFDAVTKVSSHIDWAATAVSVLFALAFVCVVAWMITINFSSRPEYSKFRLAHMFMRLDGTLDRRGLKDTILFGSSIYGYFYVLVNHKDLIIGYFTVMAAVWLGIQLADKKIPGDVSKKAPDEPPKKG